MIRNNKAQSMITVMLLIMILGVIVTLIVSSTITDTRKLLVQKSYERAYSLSEQFLTKLVSGNVLGATLGDINGIFVGSNGADNCSVGIIGASTINDYVSSVDLSCNRVGSSKDSLISCARTPEIRGMALKIQTDEPVILDYSRRALDYNTITTSNPKIYLKFKNAEAIQVSYKYEETIVGVVTPKSVSFIVSSNQTLYPGSIPIPTGSNKPLTPTYPQSLVDIVNKSGNTVLNPIPSDASGIVGETISSISGSNAKSLYIDLENLATNVKFDNNHKAKSLQIKFLGSTDFNSSPTVVDFAIHNEGFNPASQPELAYQFHKYKCSAFDSAYEVDNSEYGQNVNASKGFGSARLEAFVPINKALPDFFDYSLFVGGGIGGNSTTGYPVIINK